MLLEWSIFWEDFSDTSSASSCPVLWTCPGGKWYHWGGGSPWRDHPNGRWDSHIILSSWVQGITGLVLVILSFGLLLSFSIFSSMVASGFLASRPNSKWKGGLPKAECGAALRAMSMGHPRLLPALLEDLTISIAIHLQGVEMTGIGRKGSLLLFL